MCIEEEKEVTELLFCKQIIRILIASIIEFVTSNMKPKFDVLIKSQLHQDQKHLSNLFTKDFIILSFAFGTQQRRFNLQLCFPKSLQNSSIKPPR